MSLFRRKPEPVYDQPPSRPTTSTHTMPLLQPESDKRACVNCAHANARREVTFDRIYDSGGGYREVERETQYKTTPIALCRRSPPQVGRGIGIVTEIYVMNDHWCGEFRMREEGR